jgi:hypothetical protein
MKALKEIVFLLGQSDIHPFENLKSTTGKGNVPKLQQFFDGIAEGRFNSDAEAEKGIYGGKTGGAAYRKLKSDLRKRLFEAVINIDTDQSAFSDYQKAYYHCHRQWVVVRILTGMNANTSAMSLAIRLLKHAERFNFTLLCMDIASYLRIQYGLRESNDHKYNETDQLFIHFRSLYDAECLGEQLYTQLIVRYVNNRSAKAEVYEKALAFYEKIAVEMARHQSYKLQMYGYLIGLLRYTLVNDYENAMLYCNEAIAFFNARPYEARTPLQIFHYQNLVCNIQLRRFEEGQVSANACMQYMQDGTFNWFKYKELFLHLSLHSREYEQADKTLQIILKHPRFEFLPPNAKELWIIYESYIYYLHATGHVKSVLGEKFKLDRFIRKASIFSRDKGGINVAVIISRLLILLRERNFRQIIDEIDGINQYCYRYLRGENTKRSYYFIKMLLTIPFAQFDPKLTEQKVVQLRNKMDKIPFQVDNQTHGIEIVPYEHLWEIAMSSLSVK